MRRRLALLLALLLAGVVLSACYSGNTTSPAADVGIFGDSITYDSASAIESTLGPYYAYDLNGTPGYTIGEETPAVGAAMANDIPPPNDVILNLGTNDAILAGVGNNTNWQLSFANLLGDVGSAQCVILVTVSTNADHYWGTTQTSTVAAQINQDIYDTQATDPGRYQVIDWNSLVHQNPDWLQSGGIHPNATGQQELANWYALALTSCP